MKVITFDIGRKYNLRHRKYHKLFVYVEPSDAITKNDKSSAKYLIVVRADF